MARTSYLALCPKSYANLPEDLREAIGWAREGYGPKWRKRFEETEVEHNASRPYGIKPEIWAAWYRTPFGRPDWNVYFARLRDWFAEQRECAP